MAGVWLDKSVILIPSYLCGGREEENDKNWISSFVNIAGSLLGRRGLTGLLRKGKNTYTGQKWKDFTFWSNLVLYEVKSWLGYGGEIKIVSLPLHPDVEIKHLPSAPAPMALNGESLNQSQLSLGHNIGSWLL